MLYRYPMALVGKRLISSITMLFLAVQSQGQQTIEVIQGQLTAITIPIKSWKSDSTDPLLKIKTRDEKGLIHAQDLAPLVFTQYGQKTREEDMLWQRDTRGFQKPQPSNLRSAPMNPIPLEKNGETMAVPSSASMTNQGIPFTYQPTWTNCPAAVTMAAVIALPGMTS